MAARGCHFHRGQFHRGQCLGGDDPGCRRVCRKWRCLRDLGPGFFVAPEFFALIVARGFNRRRAVRALGGGKGGGGCGKIGGFCGLLCLRGRSFGQVRGHISSTRNHHNIRQGRGIRRRLGSSADLGGVGQLRRKGRQGRAGEDAQRVLVTVETRALGQMLGGMTREAKEWLAPEFPLGWDRHKGDRPHPVFFGKGFGLIQRFARNNRDMDDIAGTRPVKGQVRDRIGRAPFQSAGDLPTAAGGVRAARLKIEIEDLTVGNHQFRHHPLR